jgi:hypothetical protein
VSTYTQIIEAIIGDDPRLRQMYVESTEFHVAIDTIARVLIPLVQLIADDADRSEQSRRTLMDNLRRGMTIGPTKPAPH